MAGDGVTHATDEQIEIALIENNGYDRAVLDVCFSLDPNCRLSYTKPDGSGPLDPSSLWHLLCQKGQAPDLVLFDLALTPWCGRVLASSSYRDVLKNSTQNVRFLERVLRGLDSDDKRRALVELTILLRAAAETPVGTEQVFSRVDPADDRWGKATEFVRETIKRATDALARPGELESRLGAVAAWLWEGDMAAWDLSESPSILRFLLCATSFPNVCFGVVSHFADQDTRHALTTILGARSPIPWPKMRDRLLNSLVVNKADLFVSSESEPGQLRRLPDRLRESLQEWRTLGGPHSVTAPFSELRVEHHGATVTFRDWCRDQLAASVGAIPTATDAIKCTVLLDQTLLVTGGAPESHAWTCSEHAGWDSLTGGTRAQRVGDLAAVVRETSWNSRLYVVEKCAEASSLSCFLNQIGSGNVPAAPSCVVVGSDDRAVVEGLQDASRKHLLNLYRIPSDDEWPKRMLRQRGLEVANSLVEDLRVELSERVQRFAHHAKNKKERKKMVETIAKFLLDSASLAHSYEYFVRSARAMEGDLRDNQTADAVLLKHEFVLKAKLS